MISSPRVSAARLKFSSRTNDVANDSGLARRWDGSQQNHSRLAGARILVVEDEFIIALELQTYLEEAGATVVGPAHSLAAALQLAAHADISAATLDLRLASDSVGPVARILSDRGVPFIFYSGQPAGDPVRSEWPQSIVISKPAPPEMLVDALAELISTDPARAPH